MSIEANKESYKLTENFTTEFSQFSLETDIIVPDSKPDIGKILEIDTNPIIDRVEHLQDKINISGLVEIKIMYLNLSHDEHVIKSICFNLEFSESINIKNVSDDMNSTIEIDTDGIEYKISNERKVNIKLIINLETRVYKKFMVEFITGLNFEEGIEVLNKRLEIHSIVGESAEEIYISQNLNIPGGKPAMREILKTDVKIASKEIKLLSGKILLKGFMFIYVIYTSDLDGSIQFMEYELPFSEIFDMAGISENMLHDTICHVLNGTAEIKQDDDGENRVVNYMNRLRAHIRVFEAVDVNVVEDAYSYDYNLKLMNKNHVINEMIVNNKIQCNIKDLIELPSQCPPIEQIYTIKIKPYITNSRIEKDKIFMDGSLNINILYETADPENPVFSYKYDLDFKQVIEAPNCNNSMNCNFKLEIAHVNYTLNSSNQVDIRCSMDICYKIENSLCSDLISEVVLDKDSRTENRCASIIIYFIQSGDTLWKIAKKYKTSVELIKKYNNIENVYNLQVGSKLIIPRRVKNCA